MIFVDGHVHIYDCFDLHALLDSALANFRAEAARLQVTNAFTAFLLLTETAREHWFRRLKNHSREKIEMRGSGSENWTFHETSESCSLSACRAGRQTIFLVAGRQIVTAEDLEVLALATNKEFEDGRPMVEVIRTVQNSGAIPVIAWGPGKWLGKRGAIIDKALNRLDGSGLFLGDNGNRPTFWPRSSHFTIAQDKGGRILPGSDPLPFASEYRRPGSFGFSAYGTVTSQYPARDLKRIVLDPKTPLRTYGRLERAWRFFYNQSAMQVIKYQRKGKSAN